MDWRILLALFPLLVVSCIYAQGCEEPCDIYIVLTGSDNMVELPALMVGARNGLARWFDTIRPDGEPNCGPRVSLCSYGPIAEEQITPGGPLNASLIRMVGGNPHLDLGIECARNSSQANRRPGVCQCMALIVSEDQLRFDAAIEQIRLARIEGFCKITLTTVDDNVHGKLTKEFADSGFWLEILGDFGEFERRAAELSDQFHCCPEVSCDDKTRVEALVSRCAPNMSKLLARQIRNVKDWRAVCREQHNAIQSRIECLMRSTNCTKKEAEALITTVSHCFYRMKCNEGVLNQEIQTMLDDKRFNQDLIDAIDFTRCIKLRKRDYIKALYCMRHIIDIELTELNNELARLVAQFLIGCAVLMEDLSPTSDYYDFALLPRCSMRIWGEPHIETCNDNGKQTTCSAPGLQTYLDLPFLNITGFNHRVYDRITRLSEITIEFKSLVPPHPVTARYKAASHTLPSTFEFRANLVSKNDTVRLTMQRGAYPFQGDLIVVPVLVWSHTGVEIILNIWGHSGFVQFAMRASQTFMNTGTGILIEGCPEGEELPFGYDMKKRRRRSTAGIRKRDEDEASAEAACLAEGIPPNTGDMDACMFDVIAMNDTSIAEATSMSIQDRETTVSNDAERSAGAGVVSIPTGSELDYCIVGAEVPGCRPCVPNEFLPDPTDCSRYYQCLGYGKALLRKCIPKILHFNFATRRCDWRWKVRCQVASAGNGP